MNLAASASLQARSIMALMLRRIQTRYSGSRAGYLWAIIEPLCWVMVLKLAHQGAGNVQPPLGTSYEVFFATGVILARTWRLAAQAIAASLARRKGIPIAVIQSLDAAYAIWILEMLTGGLAMGLFLFGLGVFGFDAAPADLLVCIEAYAATSLFALSFGMVLSQVLVVVPGFAHFQSLMMMLIFFTSGFHMLVDRAPLGLRQIMAWNPLLHCIEWFREGFYANYSCMTLDKGYLLGVSVLFLALGLAGERAFRNKVVTGK